MKKNVAIIGGGITGCAIARTLSRYDGLNIHLIEREADVGWGVTKANTSIIHPGHEEDATVHPLRAKFCVEGNRMWRKWAEEMDIPVTWPGELMLAFDGGDSKKLEEYLSMGKKNGVEGLRRNVVQCLDDFGIPLLTGHMVKEVRGRKRVERVIVARLDEKFRPVKNSEREIECDTVALAAGLLPNTKKLRDAGVVVDPATGGPVVNEYMETSLPGVFAAGNALAINDYVDYAAEQGEQAARGAHVYISNGGKMPFVWKEVRRGSNVRLVFPHYISGENDVRIYARVKKPMKNAVISFPEIGKKRKAVAVTPGEMLTVMLKKEELAGAEGLTIDVEAKT